MVSEARIQYRPEMEEAWDSVMPAETVDDDPA